MQSENDFVTQNIPCYYVKGDEGIKKIKNYLYFETRSKSYDWLYMRRKLNNLLYES